MPIRFFLSCYLLFVLCACSSSTSQTSATNTTSIDSINANSNQNIFKDNFDREKVLYKKTFAALLDSTYYKNPAFFVERLGSLYDQKGLSPSSILSLEQQQLIGVKDSIWFINCITTPNSADSCAFPMLQTQYLFDHKGHLLHKGVATVAQFIPNVLDSTPIYMTITNDCQGNGQHHFYTYQQGKLIDVFNVLMDNTPITYDINPEGGGLFRKNHLETFIQDINQDGFNDILLKGKWLVLDNGKGRTYPPTRPFKAERVEYQFLYNPTKETFLLAE